MTATQPRIALVHATALAMEPIQSAFARHWPQARCMNLLDDSLSVDRAEAGSLTPAMVRRFVDLASYAKGTGCHAILFTCSAFGPAIVAAGEAVGLPTHKPNEAMFVQALQAGRDTPGTPGSMPLPRPVPMPVRIGLIATFEASISSMAAELQAMAAAAGQPIALHTLFVPQAMQDLAEGRAQQHHDRIAQAALRLPACDVVLLAQFSMAAAQPTVQAALACPVLSSPDCAVRALQAALTTG